LDLEPVLSANSGFQNAVLRFFPEHAEGLKPLYQEISKKQAEIAPDRSKGDPNNQDDGAIVQFVHLIIKEALKRGASDIHLEPLEKRFRIRFRVDSVLQETESPRSASNLLLSPESN
jgi:type II secretory ATPase GspE/PulE/Tfp pilus assembly ATPase PilB-like protein